MTVLYDPDRRQVFADVPCWPLLFATEDAAEVGDSAVLHARIAGARALHYRDPVHGCCAECALSWPCLTHRVLTEDLT